MIMTPSFSIMVFLDQLLREDLVQCKVIQWHTMNVHVGIL